MALLRDQPLYVYMLAIVGAAMAAPAIWAWVDGDLDVARTFGLFTLIVLSAATMLAFALMNKLQSGSARSGLLTLIGGYTLLPAVCALPLFFSVSPLHFEQAYFEALSSFTTTGATLFAEPERLSDAVHLWRGLVAWLGGGFALITAISILAPLNLGGFEVFSDQVSREYNVRQFENKSVELRNRVLRSAGSIAPIYLGATSAIIALLLILGDMPIVAVMHAMAIVSTSGISPIDGLDGTSSGVRGEVAMLLFFGLALNHRAFLYKSDKLISKSETFSDESRAAILLCLLISGFLFLRHFVGAIEASEGNDLSAALNAVWGSIFTVMSFLTTTGFESRGWPEAQNWSGLTEANLILLLLALIGGGFATTAGGIKLLRTIALFKHSEREIGRLVHPNSIAGAGTVARKFRGEGAFVAWLFVMFFLLSIGAGIGLLTFMGEDFESAFLLSVASISNVGPLATSVGEESYIFRSLGFEPRLVLCALMIVGRMEVLAVIALMNPEYWHR